MNKTVLLKAAFSFCVPAVLASSVWAQAGRRYPAEKKVVIDPVTQTPLTFLTDSPSGNSKIYQTHPDWTSDGKWLIFSSGRALGQAFAANEQTGDIVQVTDKGYTGMLCVARKSMKMYIMRVVSSAGDAGRGSNAVTAESAPANGAAPAPGGRRGGGSGFYNSRGPWQIVEIDLGKLFADSMSGNVQPGTYERVCGTTPPGMRATGNMGLDANEDFVYFSVSSGRSGRGGTTGSDDTGNDVGKDMDLTNPVYAAYEESGTNHAKPFGPRGMGGGPSGLRSMNLKTGEVKKIVDVPFQIGHVQTNPWMPGEIVFCWETGGKAPQRTWTVMADGTGLRPLYPEAGYEWITHEAVITKDEVAIAILYLRAPLAKENGSIGALPADMASRPPPGIDAWGPTGTDERPTGVGIVNLRTHEMRIVGQVPLGDPGRSIWHVNGSADGRWAAADDFRYRLWLIDRHTGEMLMLASMGEKTGAADHIHPTFNADGTEIEIESAMISANNRSLNICVVPVPKSWLARTYSDVAPQ